MRLGATFWGLFWGLASAFFIGLFMVPRRYVRCDTATFNVAMMAGAFAGTLAYWLATGARLEWRWWDAMAFLPGLNWAAGSFAYAAGAARLGITKSTGVKNTQVVVTTAGGFLFFGEAAVTSPWLAYTGSALVVLVAVVLAQTTHSEAAIPGGAHGRGRGYLWSAVASVVYGVNGLLMNICIRHDVPMPQMNLFIGIGAIVGGLGIYALRKRRLDIIAAASPRDHAWAIGGGLVWAAGLVSMVLSMGYIGVAVSWAVLNLSIVVSVLYGVFILREVEMRRHWGRIAAGLAIACIAVAVLYLSKAWY